MVINLASTHMDILYGSLYYISRMFCMSLQILFRIKGEEVFDPYF